MTVLAADTAEQIGRVCGVLLIPVLGIVLLVVGLSKRSATKRQLEPRYAPQSYPRPAGKGLIVAGAALLVLGLLATLALAATNIASRAGGLEVGDCITNTSYVAADIDPETVGCTYSSAVFELVTKTTEDANCPDGLREASGYAVLINSTTTLCFVLNLNEGECYTIEASKRSFEPSACTSEPGVVRVTKRVDGSSDETVCAPGQTSVSFPEPARVYCFAAA